MAKHPYQAKHNRVHAPLVSTSEGANMKHIKSHELAHGMKIAHKHHKGGHPHAGKVHHLS